MTVIVFLLNIFLPHLQNNSELYIAFFTLTRSTTVAIPILI